MKTTSYEGKQVYIGLDVHREFFVASCISEGVVVNRCRMPGRGEAVIALVKKESRFREIDLAALTQAFTERVLAQLNKLELITDEHVAQILSQKIPASLSG